VMKLRIIIATSVGCVAYIIYATRFRIFMDSLKIQVFEKRFRGSPAQDLERVSEIQREIHAEIQRIY